MNRLVETHFKALRGSSKGKAQRGQYLLAVDLGVTNGIRARFRTLCQPSRSSPKSGMPSQVPNDMQAFSLFPEGVDTRVGGPTSKDIGGRHKGCVPVRTLGPKGGGFGGGPTSIGGRKECQRRRWARRGAEIKSSTAIAAAAARRTIQKVAEPWRRVKGFDLFVFADEALKAGKPTGRSLLQAQKECTVDMEAQNYTILTSQCKGPKYPPKVCCHALLEFCCSFVEELNDRTNNCATTMFSYINLYGQYPPGLFANQCKGGEQGLECNKSLLSQRWEWPHQFIFGSFAPSNSVSTLLSHSRSRSRIYAPCIALEHERGTESSLFYVPRFVVFLYTTKVLNLSVFV
ncbi:GPI-anchored protein LLG1, partial [Cucurbita argyrosperma subsp. argyrosperma]